MTPRQFTTFRNRLDAASGFQSAQFRELEAMLGRRDSGAIDRYPPGSDARRRIADAMARPSLLDSFLRYLAAQGFGVPRVALERGVTQPMPPSQAVQDALVDVYRIDGPGAGVRAPRRRRRGLQEWRYRHVKMVERTIGDKAGTGGSSGRRTCARRSSRPPFPTCGPCAAACEPVGAALPRFRVAERLLLTGHSTRRGPTSRSRPGRGLRRRRPRRR
jgi:tryptophan 2,3-dioxygenase